MQQKTDYDINTCTGNSIFHESKIIFHHII